MVPFLITRIPFKLRGSSWIGTVENVEVKETVVPYLKGSLHHFYNRWFDNHIVLTVKTDDGNVLKHEAFQGNARFREFYSTCNSTIFIAESSVFGLFSTVRSLLSNRNGIPLLFQPLYNHATVKPTDALKALTTVGLYYFRNQWN